ncbi:hypothetical protein M2S00_03550 [Apilactobacillus sp. TMW 2.2459]|uniref:hypothetical protein n=1 Tax=Apilactobacillus xinyiensis TaxID=2841032 RepID=UPI001C7CCE80|nr:hypothetical protein [Apilactobacillus xinyiensis]MCL0312174.1 hypothetical protein [Apilactobacillus xinyiensis]
MKIIRTLFVFIIALLFLDLNVYASIANKNHLNSFKNETMYRYGISIDNSNLRKNKYKLVWRKKIPLTNLYLTDTDSFYSQDFKTRFYYGNNSKYLFGIPYNTNEMEKVYNKIDKRYYVFYRLNKNINMVCSAWVLNYGTIFQNSMSNMYKKMLNSNNYKYDSNLQNGAYIIARHFVDGDTGNDTLSENYQNAICTNVGSDNYSYRIIDSNSNAYCNYQFKLLNLHSLNYLNYFKRLVHNQAKFLNIANNKVGIYAYPPSSALYGRIVLFYIHK